MLAGCPTGWPFTACAISSWAGVFGAAGQTVFAIGGETLYAVDLTTGRDRWPPVLQRRYAEFRIEAIAKFLGDAAMASWRRDMGAPGNWRACVACVDRVDRGRFGSGARSHAGEAPRSQEERPDLSELSDAELEILERRYEGEGSESE